MSSIFITILRMSLTASYTALVVMLARLLLKKAPKILSYILWLVVLFRLVCWFSFESILSLIPSRVEVVSDGIALSQSRALNTGIRVIDNTFNRPIQAAHPQINTSASVNTQDILAKIGTIIWITGILLLLSYGVISYFTLKKRLSTATIVKENIFETDRIQTPFVLGLVKPRIYIPIGLSDSELDYIIKHEQIHIRRCDYIIKPISFLALTLHWFNPLIWISFFLMVKDMEMSCDESVMKESGYDIRARYSNSLLYLSVKQSSLISPLAFGESNIKSRIRNVLNYKKPGLWIILITAAAVCAIVIGLAANPKESFAPNPEESFDLEKINAEAMLFSTQETDLLKIGEAGFDHYYSTFMGEKIPKEYRITKFKLNNISLLAGDKKEFCVQVISDYSTTGLYFLSANGTFLPNGEGSPGEGEWKGNNTEFRIKSLGDNKYEIVSVGTGGGTQGLVPVEH